MFGSSFVFSVILMSPWRIYRIFEQVFTTSIARSHQCSLHDATLATVVLALALVMVTLCIPAVLTPSRVETTRIGYDTSHLRSGPIQKLNAECNFETFTYVTIPLDQVFLLYKICCCDPSHSELTHKI